MIIVVDLFHENKTLDIIFSISDAMPDAQGEYVHKYCSVRSFYY